MSRLLTLFTIASFTLIGTALTASAEPRVVSTSTQRATYRCAKCGKLHYRTDSQPTVTAATPASVSTDQSVTPATASDTPAASEVKQVSAEIVQQKATVASSVRTRASSGVSNVLSMLNAQRARIGVRALRFDPTLQAVAQRRAQAMAARGLKGHPPGSFSPGRYEGVGWSGSYSPSRVSACYTSDPRMQYAGAAMATGRDGVYFAVVYR